MKRRLDRRDMLILLISVAVYAAAVFAFTRGEFAFGSNLDWVNQHYAIPDYFRKLFYETGELFPSFAPNLGAGENIYYLSYYGLLSPVILFSYLLPGVSMSLYIQVSSAVLCFAGAALFYRFIRKRQSRGIAFLLMLCYLLVSPIFLHSHRHIMFVNYLPFLILSFEAVDSFFEGRGKWRLTLWTLMIILTSWFFSVSALAAITVYGVYRYLSVTEKFTLSDFAKKGCSFALRLLNAVLIAGALLMPTAHILISGRDKSNVSFPVKNLIPMLRYDSLGFSSYSMGLGIFAVFATVCAVIRGGKARRFLGICIAVLLCCPVVVYLLNGTMYTDAKVLIPFIPLALILCAEELEDIKSGRLHLAELIITALLFIGGVFLSKWYKTNFAALFIDLVILAGAYAVYHLKGSKRLFIAAAAMVPMLTCFFVNSDDILAGADEVKRLEDPAYAALCDAVSSKGGLWRTSLAEDHRIGVNAVITADQYSPYIYSSVHNRLYNKFYFGTASNENEYRNSSLTTRSQNPLFELFISNRYLLTKEQNVPYGYRTTARSGSITLLENPYTLPIGRCKPALGEDVFNSLNTAEKMEALLYYTVTGQGGSFEGTAKSAAEPVLPECEEIALTDSGYHIVSGDSFTLRLPLAEPLAEGQLLVLETDADNTQGIRKDISLTVNGVRNLLTAPDWKYYNHNTTFTYVIAPPAGGSLDSLTLTFSKGDYSVSRFRAWVMDYPYDACECDGLAVDVDGSGGDVIKGSITCTQNGIFELAIPFDDGFEITVDGAHQDYECVDKAFIGFPLSQGTHVIEVRFEAPLLKEGKLTSLAGLALFLLVTAYETAERIKKKKA
ncbi:MAG: YfhO family protein [Ruminococcus sp.]|nr:YfhO family protein [Ruminococcus sp.]